MIINASIVRQKSQRAMEEIKREILNEITGQIERTAENGNFGCSVRFTNKNFIPKCIREEVIQCLKECGYLATFNNQTVRVNW